VTFALAVVVGTAFLHAGWNTAAKSIGDRWVASLSIAITGGTAGIIGAIAFGLPAVASWPYVLGSALAQATYLILLTRAYSHGDMSRLYPIARGIAPLLVTVVAITVLHEHLDGWSLLGILILCVAILTLAFARGRPRRGHGIGLALATGVMISTYTVLDGIGVRVSGNIWGYIAWGFAVQSPLVVLMCLLRGGKNLGSRVRANLAKGLLTGMASVLSYGIVVWAQSRAPLPLVSALRETSVIWAVLAGRIFLSERLRRPEITAIIVAAGAAMLLQLTR